MPLAAAYKVSAWNQEKVIIKIGKNKIFAVIIDYAILNSGRR